MKGQIIKYCIFNRIVYAYDPATGLLTATEYGEGAWLTSNKDRYTEKSTAFKRNGGVTRLQRNGLRADGTYGKVDDLTVTYSGNRISAVSDAAPAVTQNGSMDYPGGSVSSAFGYNSFGALVKDVSRGITDISYDSSGNPVQVKYDGYPATFYVYSATGERLKESHRAVISVVPGEPASGVSPFAADVSANSPILDKAFNSYEFHGPVVYRNGSVDMVLFPGGYATVSGTTVTFHYYTQDSLGNNRAVINGTTGLLEQAVAYYPYGGVIADLGTNATTGQPYKFGGKELITVNGLNEYDFGARQYYSAVPGFTKPDPMCEANRHLSPYLYCANNPVNLTDPTGMYIVGESLQEWNRNRNDIVKRRDGLQRTIDNIRAKGAKKGWSQDKIDNKIGDRQERVASLDNTLSTMTTLENSEQGYSLSSNNKSSGLTSLKDGIINIEYGSAAMFCHEVTHAGQFETGDIAFITRSEGSYLNDVHDEAAAFQSQYAYDHRTVSGLNPNVPVTSISDISPGYVMGIRVSGVTPYTP